LILWPDYDVGVVGLDVISLGIIAMAVIGDGLSIMIMADMVVRIM
jgi:hypothetical protein